MATVPSHMVPGRLVWQQGLAPWHQGGWDGNRAWPNDTKEAGMATEPGHMATGRLGGNRTACMATVPGHMAQGCLDW